MKKDGYTIFKTITTEYLRSKTDIYFRKYFDNKNYTINEYFNELYKQNERIGIGQHFDKNREEQLRPILLEMLPFLIA